MIDYVVRKGFVVDGTGKAGSCADVGMDKGKCVMIGDINIKTTRTEVSKQGGRNV